MKFIAVVLLSLLSVGATPTSPSPQKALHRVSVQVGHSVFSCSAYAIGKHTLITAAHCFVGPRTILVDSQPRLIAVVVDDKNDHQIWGVTGPDFIDIVDFDPYVPVQGQRIHFWGNPSSLISQYREGYVTGTAHDPSNDLDCVMYDMRIIGGDSGSLIFDEHDRVVGMAAFTYITLSGSYNFHFTAEQIKQAKEY